MRSLLYGLLIFITTSCAKVYFVSPHPINGKTIKSIPKDMIGEYSDSTLDVKVFKDSIIVNSDKFLLTTESPDTNQVLIKNYRDFYFATFKEKAYYDVYMASFYEDKLALYMINGDERSINTLKRVVKVDTIDIKEEAYIINPSKNEFNDILEWELFELISILKKQ